MENTFKIFVSNIPYDCNKEEFNKLFVDVKGFVSSDLVMKPNIPFSRGFGYITVDSQNAYDSVMKSIIKIKERTLKFSPFDPVKKIYSAHVKFIPQDFSEQMLTNVLSKYGQVIRCHFDMNYNTKTPKGTAVVDFNDVVTFKKILMEKNIKIDDTRTIEITKRRHKQFYQTPLMQPVFYPRPYNMYQQRNIPYMYQQQNIPYAYQQFMVPNTYHKRSSITNIVKK